MRELTAPRAGPRIAMAELEGRSRPASNSADCRIKEEPPDDIKDYAENTMNELLGWYGYDKVDSRETQGLNLQHFAGSEEMGGGSSDNSSSREDLRNGACSPTSQLLNADDGEVERHGDDLLPGGCILCAWCQKVGMKLFTLKTATGSKAFCSEICFTQCRRASFKKNKVQVCDWCKHVRHTVNYVDFQDGEQQLQFCSDKCLNQYKMNIFCRETQAHLQLHPHLKDSAGGTKSNLITPELWLKDCLVGNGENASSEDESLPENLSVTTVATPPTPPPPPPLPPLPLPPPPPLPPRPPSLPLVPLGNPLKEKEHRHHKDPKKPRPSGIQQLPTRDRRERRPGRKHHSSAPVTQQPQHRRRRDLGREGRGYPSARSPSNRRSAPLVNGFAPPLPPSHMDLGLRPPFPPPGMLPNHLLAQQQMEAFLRLHFQRPPGMPPFPPGLLPPFPFSGGLNSPSGPHLPPPPMFPHPPPPPAPPPAAPPAPPPPPTTTTSAAASVPTSLLPPVTVMIPYPIPFPIPVPIPIVLPIPMDFLNKFRRANGEASKTKCNSKPSAASKPPKLDHRTTPDDMEDLDLLDDGHTSDASSGPFPDGLTSEDDLSDDDSDLDSRRTPLPLKRDSEKGLKRPQPNLPPHDTPKKKGLKGNHDL